jgi:hypothetical protein
MCPSTLSNGIVIQAGNDVVILRNPDFDGIGNGGINIIGVRIENRNARHTTALPQSGAPSDNAERSGLRGCGPSQLSTGWWESERHTHKAVRRDSFVPQVAVSLRDVTSSDR